VAVTPDGRHVVSISTGDDGHGVERHAKPHKIADS
jgi:hypothetical protein